MRFVRSLLAASTVCSVLWCITPALGAVAPSRQELAQARTWMADRLDRRAANSPFSFSYAGEPSSKLLEKWNRAQSSRKLDDRRTELVTTYTDSKTGLEVRCVAVEYSDYPTVEWTLYFKNTGKSDTPIIADIQALDINLQQTTKSEFVLHHAIGSPANGSDYGPLETPLGPGTSKSFGAAGGRPTSRDWSYYNLQWDGKGMIIAVGWPGQWSSEFARDQANGLHIRAGQELTHFKLHPGEEVRSPLILLQFWQGGDWIRAQNIWRHWMIAYAIPRPGGKLPEPMLFGCSARLFMEMCKANEENQKMCIDRYLEEGIKLDCWWMDAGWYKNELDALAGGIWPLPSYYEQDLERFPNGIRAISDHAHSKGIKALLWFEPETIYPGTWLTKNRPDWLLGNAAPLVLNLGNPAAASGLSNCHAIHTLLFGLYGVSG